MSSVRWKTIPWLKVCRVVGCLAGAAIIGLGLYALIEDEPELQSTVGNCYRIVFGLLIIVAEFQWVKLLSWFSFLLTLIGLGAFYIFVGGLALGSAAYEIAIAVILCVIGLFYCIAGMACQDDRPKAVELKTAEEVGAHSSV